MPAASHNTIVSRVLRATPPSEPADGEGRMKTSGLAEMLSMRVLSPKIEPPLRSELGSMASTASLWRSEVTMLPIASMKVDLPAPGTPADADAHRPAGMGQAAFDDLLRLRIMVGVAAFDERDGLRQRSNVTLQNALHIAPRS